MKKRLAMAIVCAAVTAAAATAAWASDFTPALDTDTEQTIRVLGNYDNFEALEAAAQSFQEYYPNVEVEYEKLDDYNSVITPRLQDDTEAALFMMNSYLFIDNDQLADLVTDISTLDISFDEIDQNACKGNYIDGKLYGIPLWYRYYGLVVNVDLLETEGIEIPTNMGELKAACEKLREAGYTPLQQTAETVTSLFHSQVMNIVANELSDEEAEALKSGEEGSAACLTPVFDTLIEFMDAGYITQESIAEYEDSYNAAILRFYEGDVPFLVATSSIVSGMAKRETLSDAFKENPFEYRFIYSPTGEKGAIVYKGNDTGFALSSNCSYPEIAAEFYRFIYTKDTLTQMSSIKGQPSTAAEPDDELYKDLDDSAAEAVIHFADIDDPTDMIQDVYYDAATALTTGEISTCAEAAAMFEELAAAKAAE